MKLETYFDVAKSLLDMFLAMANGCKAQSVYIVFDVYKESSIKNYEREVRSSGKVKIETTIVPGRQQKFPVLTEAFWACANNKAQLQNFFIDFVKNNYTGSRPLYLSGGCLDDIDACYMVVESQTVKVNHLSSNHEEADDRLLFITSECFKNTNINTVSIGSTDTDVLISLLFHIGNYHWMDNNKVLHLIWGSGTSIKVINLNHLGNDIGWDIVSSLPA